MDSTDIDNLRRIYISCGKNCKKVSVVIKRHHSYTHSLLVKHGIIEVKDYSKTTVAMGVTKKDGFRCTTCGNKVVKKLCLRCECNGTRHTLVPCKIRISDYRGNF
jgi:hypothetical protein